MQVALVPLAMVIANRRPRTNTAEDDSFGLEATAIALSSLRCCAYRRAIGMYWPMTHPCDGPLGYETYGAAFDEDASQLRVWMVPPDNLQALLCNRCRQMLARMLIEELSELGNVAPEDLFNFCIARRFIWSTDVN